MDPYNDVEQNLAELNKYSLIGIMSAGIIHELNNPVSVILANIDMLGAFLKEAKDAAEIMEIITCNAKRVSIMASQLREYVITSSPAPAALQKAEKSDISAVIDKVLAIMRNRLKYRITVHYERKQHPPANCSLPQLSQVLMNIVSNAAESIEDKGVIEITSFNEDNHITIKISDTGSGIPESIKLFEPFQTTKLLSGHAGIGLFISKKIIEMRGGRISCSSESNRGTTVTIILPAA